MFSSFDGMHAEGIGALAPMGAARDLIEMRGSDLFAAMRGGDALDFGLFAQLIDFGIGQHLMLGVVRQTLDLSRRPALFGAAVSLRDVDTELKPAADALVNLDQQFQEFHTEHLVGRESTGAMRFFPRAQQLATTQSLRPSRTDIFRADPELTEYETCDGLLRGIEAAEMPPPRIIAIMGGQQPETLPVLSAARIDGYLRIARERALAKQHATSSVMHEVRHAMRHNEGQRAGLATAHGLEKHASQDVPGPRTHPSAPENSGPAALLVEGLENIIDGLGKSEKALGITGDAARLRYRLQTCCQNGALRQSEARALLMQVSAATENLRRHMEVKWSPNRGEAARAESIIRTVGKKAAGGDLNKLTHYRGRRGTYRHSWLERPWLLLVSGLALLALAGLTGLWLLRGEGEPTVDPSSSLIPKSSSQEDPADTLNNLSVPEVNRTEALPGDTLSSPIAPSGSDRDRGDWSQTQP